MMDYYFLLLFCFINLLISLVILKSLFKKVPPLVEEKKEIIPPPTSLSKEKAVLVKIIDPHPQHPGEVLAVFGRNNPQTGQLYSLDTKIKPHWYRTAAIKVPDPLPDNYSSLEEYVKDHESIYI